MRYLFAIIVLLLAGCQQVADVSALPEPQQRWAVAAFAQEGIDSCIHCDGPSIEVRLDPTLSAPYAGFTDIAQGRTRIRLRLDRMTPCDLDDVRQRFIVTTRHEARHAQGYNLIKHDDDPNRLMHDPAPCYPVD